MNHSLEERFMIRLGKTIRSTFRVHHQLVNILIEFMTAVSEQVHLVTSLDITF